MATLPAKNAANAWLLRAMSAEAQRQGLDPIAQALNHALAKAAAKKPRFKIKQFIRQWTKI